MIIPIPRRVKIVLGLDLINLPNFNKSDALIELREKMQLISQFRIYSSFSPNQLIRKETTDSH